MAIGYIYGWVREEVREVNNYHRSRVECLVCRSLPISLCILYCFEQSKGASVIIYKAGVINSFTANFNRIGRKGGIY